MCVRELVSILYVSSSFFFGIVCLQEYVQTINSCYPPEIVQYYSPNYSDSLLKKLEDYDMKQ